MNRLARHLAVAASAALACSLAAPASAFNLNPDDIVDVLEYVNDYTGHYFLVSEDFEKRALDSGAAGPGWHPTGHLFDFYASYSSAGSDVCRFYAPAPNSHFYTANVDECSLLRSHPELGWIYEGVHFRADTPVNGACAAGRTPIYRLYNNRFQFNDSSHRYVAETSLRDQLVDGGWIDEGVQFCARIAVFSPTKQFAATSGAVRPLAECANEDLNLGSCIAMNGLPASLPTRVVDWVAPLYVTRGPQWSQAFTGLTGFDGDVFTNQSAFDTNAILAHSFVQKYDFATSPAMGFHVSSLDSLTPLASIEPLYQFSTREPAAGVADARVFPWRLPRENYIDLSFTLAVKTARRSDPQSHAYGAPMVEFRDTRGGGSIDVTVLTFATFPPGDFVSVADPSTGNVFVSTSFGDHQSFGTRVSGDFISCDGQGPCSNAGFANFDFRITKDDFARILAMASTVNPALSQDVNDYLLVNMRFRNGILGSADLGDSINSLGISIFGY
jgi:Repeat of unknown function (DUF5648)